MYFLTQKTVPIFPFSKTFGLTFHLWLVSGQIDFGLSIQMANHSKDCWKMSPEPDNQNMIYFTQFWPVPVSIVYVNAQFKGWYEPRNLSSSHFVYSFPGNAPLWTSLLTPVPKNCPWPILNTLFWFQTLKTVLLLLMNSIPEFLVLDIPGVTIYWQKK